MSPSLRKTGLSLVAGALVAAVPLLAEGRVAPENMPGPLKEVGFDQNLGTELPLDAALVDESGRAVRLGDYFGERPVVLAFVYYECPMLCSLVLNGIAKSFGVLPYDVGEELEMVAISIDPGETPELARAAKASTVERYGRPETADGWHFLTGDAPEIERIARAGGFRYVYLEDEDEYAHAAGILVATPEGTVSRYFFGIEYAPKDLRLAVVEASSGAVGSLIDQVLLYCFRYDPKLGKYTAVTMRIVRLAGAAFSLALGTFLFVMWRRERALSRRHAMGTAHHTPGSGAA